jgi:hypothetical protein
LRGKNAVRRPVAFENAVRREPLRRAFHLNLLDRLAESRASLLAKTLAMSMSR